MNRRNFMKMIAASGMVTSLPLSIQQAHAAGSETFLVVVNAGGGWDPTSLCDPKGYKTDGNGNMVDGVYAHKSGTNMGNINRVPVDSSKRFGDIQWSAIPDTADGNADTRQLIEQQYDEFFKTYGDRLIVVNGINTQTNSHSIGNRHVWSGKKDPGFPGIGALHAAAAAPHLPMSFITNGGYSHTAGLIAKSRANDVGYISTELADPNYHSASSNADASIFYRDDTSTHDEYDNIVQAIEQRQSRLKSNTNNTGFRNQLSQLFSVQGNSESLKRFGENLSLIEEGSFNGDWNPGRNNGMKNQAKIAAAAFVSGLAASTNISAGGFDTHGNHDQSHYRKLGDVLETVHYLNEALSFFGIADRTLIMVASDFGRTPWFNKKSGKDHWSYTSNLILAPQGHQTGGKVFGATNELFKGVKVNPNTGQADESGIELTPAHVNKAVQKFLGIQGFASAAGFDINAEDIQLFS